MDKKIKILFYYAGFRNLNESAGGVCKALINFIKLTAEVFPSYHIDIIGDLVKENEFLTPNILISKTPDNPEEFLKSYNCFLPAMHLGVFKDVAKPKNQVWIHLEHCWNKSTLISRRESAFDFAVALSKLHKNNLSKQHFTSDSLRVIPNILDNVFFDEEKAERAKYSIMFAGALVKHKGVDKLVDAFLKVKEIYPQSILNIYGDDKIWRDKENILSFDRGNLQKENIFFKGALPHKKMPCIYASHSVLVLPSALESFSLVCAEAQSQGCIPIAHNSGGVSAVIDDGNNGFLYSPNNSFVIADKIIEVLNLLDKDESIRQKAKASVRKSFFASNVTDKIKQLFKEMENKLKEKTII